MRQVLSLDFHMDLQKEQRCRLSAYLLTIWFYCKHVDRWTEWFVIFVSTATHYELLTAHVID